LKNTNENFHFRWFAEYGCVWLAAKGIGYCQTTKYDIFVLFPDKWTFAVHNRIFHSNSCGYSVIQNDSVPVENFPVFCNQFNAIFEKAILQRGDRRSAGGDNGRGHQRTPQFISSILTDAFHFSVNNSASQTTQPRGGATDVGVHTGGIPRSTCWSIIAASLRFLLRLPKFKDIFLFEFFKADFDVWVAEDFLSKLSSQNSGNSTLINATMDVLSSLALYTSSLAEKGQDVSRLEMKCKSCRTLLDTIVGQKMVENASRLTFPDLSNLPINTTNISLNINMCNYSVVPVVEESKPISKAIQSF